MLLFSVHPEPEGRKVDKMLTLKKVKEMVKAPVHTKRVPSPKVLLEDGRILLRKEFEHDSHLTLYHSGYVWFSTGKRNTVFHIHDCRGDYAYDAAEGKGDVIKALNADDLWLKFMEALQDTKVVWCPCLWGHPANILENQSGLCDSNVGDNRNDKYLEQLSKHFPEVITKIAKEKELER